MKTNTETQFPSVSKPLIESLEEAFPSRDFGISSDLDALNYHYGQRSVVAFLRQFYEIQNENILNPNN